jgi:hypothetical protein
MFGLNEIRSMNAVKNTGLGASSDYQAKQEYAKQAEKRLRDREAGTRHRTVVSQAAGK